MPGHVGNGSRELDAPVGILGGQRVRILNKQRGVEQYVGVFVDIRGRGFSEAEVDSVLVGSDDCIDWRGLPGAETLEAKFVPVIREGRWQIRCEELWRDLADHAANIAWT